MTISFVFKAPIYLQQWKHWISSIVLKCARGSNDSKAASRAWLTFDSALNEFLAITGPQLRQLTVLHPMNSLFPGALDLVLTWCPNLLALCVSADYISDQLFEDDTHIRQNHPLRSLNLNCSPTAEADVGVLPDSIWLAIDSGCLPYLRSIKVNERLAWTATNRLRTSVSDLAELLEQKEKEIPTGMKPRIWSVVN